MVTGQIGSRIKACAGKAATLLAARPHVATMRVTAFLQALLLLPLLQEAATLYYKPRPLVCPVTYEVQHVEETLEVTQLEVVTTPFVVSKVTLNTVYESRPVTVTHVSVHTVTAEPQLVQVTEVQLVRETLPLTAVKVSTVTQEVVDTSVSFFTATATNYVSSFQTLSALKTQHATATTLETLWLATTVTINTTSVSSVTVTEAALRTSVLVSTVPHTITAATETHLETRKVFYTHTLTKMITSTVCLGRGDLLDV